MRHFFDPDEKYPDCMIADDEPQTATKPTRCSCAQLRQSMHPVRYEGYIAAKRKRVNSKRTEPEYWNGVLQFCSKQVKTDLSPIEEQVHAEVPLEAAAPKPVRRKLDVMDLDAPTIPVPREWIPPYNASQVLEKLMSRTSVSR